jgi:hypothetical protein
MRQTLAILMLATLAGCSTKYDLSGTDWGRPGTMFQDVTYDEIECARAAREQGRTPDLIVGGLADVGRYFVAERQRRGTFEQCMQARGYRPTSS